MNWRGEDFAKSIHRDYDEEEEEKKMHTSLMLVCFLFTHFT